MHSNKESEEADFVKKIDLILSERNGWGSFVSVNSVTLETHQVSLATGLAREFSLKEYQKVFGPIPSWVELLHPAKQHSLCSVAVRLNMVLPSERPMNNKKI